MIKSGTVTEKEGKFFVTVLTNEEPKKESIKLNDAGLGVDLGVKELALASNGHIFENKNRQSKMRGLEKRLKREQRSLSRKYENKKKGDEKPLTKRTANIEKMC